MAPPMTSALDPISPNTSACPIGVDLLRSGWLRTMVTTTRLPSNSSMMPKTQARCDLRRTHLIRSYVNDEPTAHALRDAPRSGGQSVACLRAISHACSVSFDFL